MGALVGLGVGAGLLLVWSAFTVPTRSLADPGRRGRLADAPRERRRDVGVDDGIRGPVRGARCGHHRGWSRSCRGPPPVAVAFGVMATYLPVALVRSRARRRLAGVRRGVAGGRRQPGLRGPGRSVPARRAGRARGARAGAAACRRSPSSRSTTRSPAGSARAWTVSRTGSPTRSVTGSIEGLRIAREVGGGQLGRLLRNLSGYLRDEARTRSEMESRQAWTVNGARLAVAAPWLVLLIMSVPDRGDHPVRLAGGRGGPRRRRGPVLRGLPADDARSAGCPPNGGSCHEPGAGGAHCWARLPGLGLLLVVSRVQAIRRPQLAVRVLPYVRDLPRAGHGRPACGCPPLRRPRPSPGCSARRSAPPRMSSSACWAAAASVRRRLERAGLDKSVHDFRVEQVLWGLVGVRGAGGGRACSAACTTPSKALSSLVLCLLAFAFGVIARDVQLSSQVTRRERDILLEFPTLAELLALAVAAGESPVAALDRVVGRSGGELSRDLAGVLAAIRTGRARRLRLRPARGHEPAYPWSRASPTASPSLSSAGPRWPTYCTRRPPTSVRQVAASSSRPRRERRS